MQKNKKWTPEQKIAIEQSGSVLVSASAGTGKTAVMTEKVVNFLLNSEIGIEGILVITFSNAAAKEMAERIEKRLDECSYDENLPLSKRKLAIKRKMDINNASIETFHAFCREVISKYYYKVGISSDFTVGEPNTISMMKRKIIDDILEEQFRKKEKAFLTLAEYIDGSERLEDVVFYICEKMQNIVNTKEWKEKTINNYSSNETFPEEILRMISSDFRSAALLLNKAIEECEDEKTSQKIKDELEAVKDVLRKINSDTKNAITDVTLSRICTRISYPRKIDCSTTKVLRNNANQYLDFYKKNNITTSTQTQRIFEMKEVVECLILLCEKVNNEFTKEKRKEKLIDFNDMEHLALEILNDTAISNQYKAQFGQIFIDEYQDTNPIQEEIISKIAKKNNLFCVGDLKQSIYGFRASDPTLFFDRKENYIENKSGTVISLNRNFRSSQNVLDCANDVLAIASKTSSDIVYDDEQKLIHQRNDDSTNDDVVIRVLTETTKPDDLTNDETEVYNIVDIIKKQIGKEIFDPETNSKKNTEYKDICILCRKLSGISELFYKIFSDEQIPFSIEKPTELFNTIEIENIINIIEIIVNPNNDVGLISFIHMGFLDFCDEDLVKIRKFNYSCGLYENICNLAVKETEIGAKCKNLLNFINKHSNEVGQKIDEILNNVLSELNYLDYIAVMPNGKQRICNVDMFKQYVHDYDTKKRNEATLYDFMRYLKKIKKDNPVVSSEVNSTIDTNRVKITTIHKSKGLEYPIVILPFVGKEFNKKDSRANVVFDIEYGLGLRYFNNINRSKGRTLIREFITRKQKERAIEEELRLLYVAMTRAKEKLIIQGFTKEEIEYSEEQKSMFDWIKNAVFTKGMIRYGECKTITGNWFVEEGIKSLSKSKKQEISSKIKEKYLMSLCDEPGAQKKTTHTDKLSFTIPKLN